MEIERKYLIDTPPEDYRSWPFHQIEQAYLCTAPTVRIRREDDSYYMTYKSAGLLAREEYNLPLTKEAYRHLLTKADGRVLTKKRYLLPLREAYCRVHDAADGTGSSTATECNAAGTALSAAAAAAADTLSQNAADLTVEMDVFEGAYEGLILAEVEFPDEETALAFTPPEWFGRDVTFTGEYSNSRLAMASPSETP